MPKLRPNSGAGLSEVHVWRVDVCWGVARAALIQEIFKVQLRKAAFFTRRLGNEKTVQDICSPTVNALQTAAWERLMMVFDILAWFPNAQYTKTKMQMQSSWQLVTQPTKHFF